MADRVQDANGNFSRVVQGSGAGGRQQIATPGSTAAFSRRFGHRRNQIALLFQTTERDVHRPEGHGQSGQFFDSLANRHTVRDIERSDRCHNGLFKVTKGVSLFHFSA
jgi:hypothetical protein